VQSIYVRHNAEIAHRLSQLPGKCQRIHGHSLQIELWLSGKVNEIGILEGLDFGQVKKAFRAYIDETYDHHLLLNVQDPLLDFAYHPGTETVMPSLVQDKYPGAVLLPGDPTIENLTRAVGEWADEQWPKLAAVVKVQETNSNGAMWER
jgi:6-pyruvoyltetrahydropterin/6-carboxytetrahydropterin synthase